MIDEPLVWHYGLMAERWAEFINEAREVPYYSKQDRAIRAARSGPGLRNRACAPAATSGRS